VPQRPPRHTASKRPLADAEPATAAATSHGTQRSVKPAVACRTCSTPVFAEAAACIYGPRVSIAFLLKALHLLLRISRSETLNCEATFLQTDAAPRFVCLTTHGFDSAGHPV
jgi:hypothetical protein